VNILGFRGVGRGGKGRPFLFNKFISGMYLDTKNDRPSFQLKSIFSYIRRKKRLEILVVQSPSLLLSSCRCTERGKDSKESEGDKYKTTE
jgi:hypothetical protein